MKSFQYYEFFSYNLHYQFIIGIKLGNRKDSHNDVVVWVMSKVPSNFKLFKKKKKTAFFYIGNKNDFI